MDNLVKKFYGLNTNRSGYESQTNYTNRPNNLTNTNNFYNNFMNIAPNTTRSVAPNYFSSIELNSIADKILPKEHFSYREEKDPVKKLTLMEEKLKNLESNVYNQENTKNLLNIIKNNIFEQTKMAQEQLLSNPAFAPRTVKASYMENKNKFKKFNNAKEKFYESDYPEDMVEAVADLHDNIEDFKEDIKFQLKSIQNRSDRVNVEDIAKEIHNYKVNYQDHINDRKGQNMKEIGVLVGKLNEFKSDIQKEIEEHTVKNRNLLEKLTQELGDFRKHCNEKIDTLEKKQNSNIDSVKFFFDRTKKRQNSRGKDSMHVPETAEKFARPKKREITDMVKNLTLKNQRSSISGEDITKFLKKKESMNKEFDEELLEEEKVNPLHIKKNSIYKENKKLAKRSINYNLKPLNKFRAAVYAVIAQREFRLLLTDNLTSLKNFVNEYEQMDAQLNNWVFNSVKTLYNSIVSFPDLKLDLSESGLLFNISDSELKNKFIKLETRLDGFIEALVSNSKSDKLGKKLINYLSSITSEKKYIPKDFFTSFELHRLEFSKNGYLINIDPPQKKMILLIYIINKILVHNILVLNKFSSGDINNNSKKNFKLIASIFYKVVIDYLIDNVPVVENTNEDNEEVNNYIPIEIGPNVKDEKFINNYNDYWSIKFSENRETERKLLSVFKKKQGKGGNDSTVNDITFISANLNLEKEVLSYYKLEKKFDYNLQSKIVSWVENLMKLLG